MLAKLDRKTTSKVLKIVTHVGSLVPLAWLLWDWWFYLLGPNEIQAITIRTGQAAIILLALSLAVTPLNTVFGWKQLIPLRRPLGLYAFLYVSLHLLIFLVLDYGLNLAWIQEALFEKWYALLGFSAYMILLFLAATSTKWAMRKMGKNWKSLHRWVYLGGILAVAHYYFAVKTVTTRPLLIITVILILLIMRIGPVKQTLLRWQRRRKGSRNLVALNNQVPE
jgi:sulfoxide reductase heme-binding subunit YedZ